MTQSFGQYTILYVTLLIITLVLIAIMRLLGESLQTKLIQGNGLSKSSYILLAPGTIIHELSHAIMCLIFFHRIVGISLFNPQLDDGTLGYVKDDYRQDSFYQKLGNPFIGIAPLIGISLVLIFIYKNIFMNDYANIQSELITMSQSGIFGFFKTSFVILGSILKSFLSFSGFFKGLLFLLLSAILSSGMSLSDADIQHTKDGFGLLIVLTFVIGIIMNQFSPASLTQIVVYFNLLFALSVILILFQLIDIVLINRFIK